LIVTLGEEELKRNLQQEADQGSWR